MSRGGLLAKFKGSVYASTRMFVEREFGERAHARVMGELSPTEREVLEAAQLLGWVPVEPVLQYHYAMDRVFGSGDLSVCTAAGRFSAGWAINTVLKVYVRMRSPFWLVDRATSVWGRYHDSGRWEIEKQTGNRIAGQLKEFQVRSPAFCARLRGWLEGAVGLTGGKHAAVTEPRCVNHGHPGCTFNVSWQE